MTGRGNVLAAQLGQVAAGGDADLGRQVLHEHRHQVRGDDHPHAAGSRTWRRRRCWWRSCRGRRRRPRPRTRARAARARPRTRPRERSAAQRARRARGAEARRRRASARRVGGRRRRSCRHLHAHRARPARRRARARRRRSATNSGPPNGCLSTTSSGARARCRARRGSAASPGRSRTRARTCRVAPGSSVGQARASAPPRSRGRASGSGRRAGRASGRRAWRRSAPRAPRRARARAPRPRRARGPTARRALSARYSSSSRWWRSTSSATRAPVGGELHAVVGLVRRRARARRACVTIAEAERGRDAQALGERGRGDGLAVARLERVDRLRVVLDGGGDASGRGLARLEIMACLTLKFKPSENWRSHSTQRDARAGREVRVVGEREARDARRAPARPAAMRERGRAAGA